MSLLSEQLLVAMFCCLSLSKRNIGLLYCCAHVLSQHARSCTDRRAGRQFRESDRGTVTYALRYRDRHLSSSFIHAQYTDSHTHTHTNTQHTHTHTHAQCNTTQHTCTHTPKHTHTHTHTHTPKYNTTHTHTHTQHNTTQHTTPQHNTTQHNTTQHNTTQHTHTHTHTHLYMLASYQEHNPNSCICLCRSIFMQLHDVKLEKAHEHILDDSSSDDVRDVPYTRYSRTPAGLSPGDRGRTSSGLSSGMQPRSTTPPKIDKRLHQHFVSRLLCFTGGARWEVCEWRGGGGWGRRDFIPLSCMRAPPPPPPAKQS